MNSEYDYKILEEVKLFKGIMDNLQDELLFLIISESKQRILIHINSKRVDKLEVIPDELDFVIRDVSIKRFNKIDSEGTKSNSQEGLKLDWEKGYLDEYEDILKGYYDKEDEGRKGSIKFI